MTTILVFLQNAWSPLYAGKKWPRRDWLQALDCSRSGQRLRSLESGYCFGDTVWYYENASPIVGADPDSKFLADIHHMRKTMLKVKPCVIVAMGKEAHRGAMIACGDHPLTILVPHPASRVLTNDLYRKVGQDISMLHMGFRPPAGCTLVSYKQRRGHIETHPDPWLIHQSLAKS